jgi:hypothetical protein
MRGQKDGDFLFALDLKEVFSDFVGNIRVEAGRGLVMEFGPDGKRPDEADRIRFIYSKASTKIPASSFFSARL